jgi:hypothetical protein
MLSSDNRIRGKSMHVADISRQQFSKMASRRFQGRMTLTGQGLALGAGNLLAKLDDKALSIEAEQERIWTLLAVAYGRGVPLAVLGSLRRVAKHWQGGDKSLAAIHLAQMGLPDIGEAAAYRLSLAAELLDAGVAPRDLARELGLSPIQFDVSKYDENQPRVPVGSGRESGQWTSSGDAAGPALTEGRSAAGANSGEVNRVYTLPKDAIVVTMPDGTTVADPSSDTKKLMAPPRANFQAVYAAGERLAARPILEQIGETKAALEQFGTYDFQRDKATNTWFADYVHAANYAVGVYMAGLGYEKRTSVKIAQTCGFFRSSKGFSEEAKEWTEKGWEDAYRGDWRSQ